MHGEVYFHVPYVERADFRLRRQLRSARRALDQVWWWLWLQLRERDAGAGGIQTAAAQGQAHGRCEVEG